MHGHCAHTHGAMSAEDALREIESDISFLEDAPEEKLAPQLKLISRVGERLKILKEKLH